MGATPMAKSKKKKPLKPKKPKMKVAGDSQELVDLQRLLTKKEPLHDDLLPYLEESSALGGQFVRHPLFVGSLMSNAYANHFYLKRKKAVDEARQQKKWDSFVALHERAYWLEALLEIERMLPDKQYWQLLAEVWSDIENIWQYKKELGELLNSKRGSREFIMDDDERKAYTKLPDSVTIYRGFDRPRNKAGWSWTTDRAKAEWFAKRFAVIDGRKPMLAIGTCQKADVVAYFLGRGESEIVVNPAKVKFIEAVEVKAS
jgi:hypothetical protein